jgi:hypothetical protein
VPDSHRYWRGWSLSLPSKLAMVSFSCASPPSGAGNGGAQPGNARMHMRSRWHWRLAPALPAPPAAAATCSIIMPKHTQCRVLQRELLAGVLLLLAVAGAAQAAVDAGGAAVTGGPAEPTALSYGGWAAPAPHCQAYRFGGAALCRKLASS